MLWELTPDRVGYMESFQKAIVKADSEDEAIEIANEQLPSKWVKQVWKAKAFNVCDVENGVILAEFINA